VQVAKGAVALSVGIMVLVVASGNFSDPNVLVMCMVGALLMLAGLMLTASELGKRPA
jgi:hypothetical protein